MGFLGSLGGIIGGAIGGPLGSAIGGTIGNVIGGGGAGGAGGAGGGPVVVQVESMPCPTVSNTGLIGAWTAAKVGALLISANATKNSYDAARDRYKIARRYHVLAKDQWDMFNDNYRPIERIEMAEIRAEGKYYTDWGSDVAGHLSAIPAVFANVNAQRNNIGAKFCVCPDTGILTQFEIAKSTISGDLENFARRYAEVQTEEKNDIRFARRVAAANRGRSLLADSTAFATKASNFYGEYSEAMTSVAQGAAQFAGFIDQRRRTEYNGPRDRVDNRPPQGPMAPTYSHIPSADWTTMETNFVETPTLAPMGEGSFASGGFGELSIQQ